MDRNRLILNLLNIRGTLYNTEKFEERFRDLTLFKSLGLFPYPDSLEFTHLVLALIKTYGVKEVRKLVIRALVKSTIKERFDRNQGV